MNVVLTRLNTSFHLDLLAIQSRSQIEDAILNMPTKLREELALQHIQIKLEYQLLCDRLSRQWRHNATPAFRQCLEETLRIAKLLDVLYDAYLDIPREHYRFHNDAILMQNWLHGSNEAITAEKKHYSKTVRENTSLSNLFRLLILRIRRLLLALTKLNLNLPRLSAFMNSVEPYAAPFFSNLAWIIFIPRMAVNLTMAMKHGLPNPLMRQEERSLSWALRARVQLYSRFSELSNDVPWCAFNLVSRFVLTGALASYALMFSVGAQVYEVFQSLLVFSLEMKHLNKLYAFYKHLPEATDKSSPLHLETQAFIQRLEQHIRYEKKRLSVPLVNSFVILITAILATSFFAGSPWVALVGAMLSILASIVSYRAKMRFEKQNPMQNVITHLDPTTKPQEKQNRFGFFNPKKENNSLAENPAKPCYPF